MYRNVLTVGWGDLGQARLPAKLPSGTSNGGTGFVSEVRFFQLDGHDHSGQVAWLHEGPRAFSWVTMVCLDLR